MLYFDGKYRNNLLKGLGGGGGVGVFYAFFKNICFVCFFVDLCMIYMRNSYDGQTFHEYCSAWSCAGIQLCHFCIATNCSTPLHPVGKVVVVWESSSGSVQKYVGFSLEGCVWMGVF